MSDYMVIQKIGTPGITQKPQSFAHRLWLDYQTTLGNIMGEFMLVRFNEAITGAAGSPIFITWDATRGIWTGVQTYSAALKQSVGGISLATGYAQGDYDYIQCKGPNVVTMTSTAAMTAGRGIQHSAAADQKVKECDPTVLADVVCIFGILLKAQGGAGTIGVGEASIHGRF